VLRGLGEAFEFRNPYKDFTLMDVQHGGASSGEGGSADSIENNHISQAIKINARGSPGALPVVPKGAGTTKN
jgi:hypothetical protein